ncbi:tetratricopeptide repeat protein [Algoriphagus namhaensis]|uniref:Tetratricopeptide repeat protein n=1 Tax=Algoriphagus namhaensis TaxID=915353 RepID=A0ABV8AR89_9BACT
MRNIKANFWVVLIAIFGSMLYVHTHDFGYSGDDGIYSHFNRVTKEGLDNWQELFEYGSMNFIQINPVNSSIYRPLTLLTFGLENELAGGFSAPIGHRVNIVLYALVLMVIGWLLVRLVQIRNLPIWLALMILLLYAVHPIHSEVVASVKSRDTLLCSLFAFSAILIWVNSGPKPKVFQQIIVAVFFFLSLISKEESIPLMALVAAISYFFFQKSLKDSIFSVAPFLIPVVTYMGIRAVVLDEAITIYNSMINSILYGTTPGELLATNFYIYIQYIKLLFFPHPLSWDYSFSQFTVQSFANPLVWFSVLFFGGLLFVAYKGFKTRNLFSFGIIFYIATFSIFANLSRALIIGSNLGERFQFIPSLAFCFLICYGLFKLSDRFSTFKKPLFIGVVLLPIVLAFSWKTVDRAKVWESNLTLSASGVKTSPKSWRTHMFYGDELRQRGSNVLRSYPDSAKMYFAEAVKELDKGYEIIAGKVGVSQFLGSLAESYLGLGDSTKAISILERSTIENPNSSFAFIKLGYVELARKNVPRAEEWFIKGLKAPNPDYFGLYKALGTLYDRENENLRAIAAFKKALEYSDDREVKRALGFLYFQEGDEKTAKTYFPEDEDIDMDEVRFIKDLKLANLAFKKENYQESVVLYASILDRFEEYGGSEKYPKFYGAYGESLIETGDTIQSKNYLLKAYDLNPIEPVICMNLGVISFFHDKDYNEAARYFKESIDAGIGDLYSAWVNLGSSQIVAGKEADAVESFEKALEIKPTVLAVKNLYLLNKNLGNQEQAKYYLSLLQPSTVTQ